MNVSPIHAVVFKLKSSQQLHIQQDINDNAQRQQLYYNQVPPTNQPPVAIINRKPFNKVSQRQITANQRIKHLASISTKHRLTRVDHGILHS